jgi:hypothetical protein
MIAVPSIASRYVSVGQYRAALPVDDRRAGGVRTPLEHPRVLLLVGWRYGDERRDVADAEAMAAQWADRVHRRVVGA